MFFFNVQVHTSPILGYEVKLPYCNVVHFTINILIPISFSRFGTDHYIPGGSGADHYRPGGLGADRYIPGGSGLTTIYLAVQGLTAIYLVVRGLTTIYRAIRGLTAKMYSSPRFFLPVSGFRSNWLKVKECKNNQ